MKGATTAEHEQRQHDAWAVHRALLWAEVFDPSLRNNPQWKLHRMDAFETFHNSMTEGCRNGN